MRILQITPGAGSFYQGGCLRDLAMVRAWRKIGHEATLVPMYFPVLGEDDDPPPLAPLFYSSVNVGLQQRLSWFRHTPRWLDRLFELPLLLHMAARRINMGAPEVLGPLTLSLLRGADGNQSKELAKLADWLRRQPKPDLIVLSNALLLGIAPMLKEILPATRLAVTFQGEHALLERLPPADRAAAWQLLGARSRAVDARIAVSTFYAELMAQRLGLARDSIAVVHNGLGLEEYIYSYDPPFPPVIGYLARLCPEKGLDTLVEAFILLKHRDQMHKLRLRIAGGVGRADYAYMEGLRARLLHEGLLADVDFLPNLSKEDKGVFLTTLSVLSVPATYGEAFGIYLLEAWATGVPVVQPAHGAFPELLAATGGGLLVEPNSAEALARGLRELLLDPQRATQLGRQARDNVLRKFSIEQAAGEVLRVCRGGLTTVAGGRPLPPSGLPPPGGTASTPSIPRPGNK